VIPLAEGTGMVSLSLAGQSGGALAPVVLTLTPAMTITRYTISFAGPSSQPDITDWNGTGTRNITLPVGTWTITVAGFLSDNKKVREGSVTGIAITDRGVGTVNITLSPVFDSAGGAGTFTYATGPSGINFSAVPTVNSATLKIAPLGSSSSTTKNLLNDAEKTGSITLAAGQYDMTVRLAKPDGSAAIHYEMVHIYSGLTTEGPKYSVGEANFVMLQMVNWSAARATDVGHDASTSTLTLVFDAAITGLGAGDITIGTGATPGVLSQLGGAGTYTVALSGISKGGPITVTVSKSGYEINPASQIVNILRAADTPVISAQPQPISCVANATGQLVSVTVDPASDGGTISYLWYKNMTNSNTGGSSLGFTNRGYNPPVAANGVIYYYCVVTNTLANNYPTNGQTKSVTSNVVAVTVAAQTYRISLSQSGTQTFATQHAGYSPAPAALSVNITNTGNQSTGTLTAALSGAGQSSFKLSKTSITAIAVGGSSNAAFNVQPNTGVTAGTYTATVTVSGSNGISATFNVSFTVNELYSITYDLDGGTNNASNPANYTVASADITLQAPTKTDYTFDGWYTNSALTTSASAPAIPKGSNGNKTFYARWQSGSGSIGVVTETGITDANLVRAPSQASYSSATFTITAPTGFTTYAWTIDGATPTAAQATAAGNVLTVKVAGLANGGHAAQLSVTNSSGTKWSAQTIFNVAKP
jgi:uncharacterized repeat protein (TIGR02543 family)